MIEDFSNEFTKDDIHVRDHLQFELKSEFFINPQVKSNIFKQELYLFIPSQLQINTQTYTKGNFYLDQTNLIRYKTPRIDLRDLIDPLYKQSPLYRIQQLIQTEPTSMEVGSILDELRLFGNMFKTALRERIYQIAHSADHPLQLDIEARPRALASLCDEIKEVCLHFRLIQNRINHNQLRRHFKYVDEFVSNTLDEYLTILLHAILEDKAYSKAIKDQLAHIILHEKNYRQEHHLGPKIAQEKLFSNESILHRKGLLNRYVLEALQLRSYRSSFEEQHGNLLGAFAAGIATFIYTLFFIWNNSAFVSTSASFILLAVIIYALRDIIKEGLRKVFYKKANQWLQDYSTVIKSPRGTKIGRLKENFTFIEQADLPAGFLEIRNYHFNEELQALQRYESIIQYKREVELMSHPYEEGRRRELTMVFRLNIKRLIRDASDALHPALKLDAYTRETVAFLLPKVYHLNILIRNTFLNDHNVLTNEIKKYRVVVDKAGIKRVEQIK